MLMALLLITCFLRVINIFECSCVLNRTRKIVLLNGKKSEMWEHHGELCSNSPFFGWFATLYCQGDLNIWD